jgi:hypothetical protein
VVPDDALAGMQQLDRSLIYGIPGRQESSAPIAVENGSMIVE